MVALQDDEKENVQSNEVAAAGRARPLPLAGSARSLCARACEATRSSFLLLFVSELRLLRRGWRQIALALWVVQGAGVVDGSGATRKEQRLWAVDASRVFELAFETLKAYNARQPCARAARDYAASLGTCPMFCLCH